MTNMFLHSCQLEDVYQRMDLNKERASDEQINLTTILTPFEYSMFDEYEKQCFTAEYLFFSMLPAISRCSQKSGSAKSQHISEIIHSAKATQKLFSSTYITTFPVGRNNGKREESSIVEEPSIYRFAQNKDGRPLLERENYNENDVYEYDQENKNQDDLLLNIVSMRESMSLTSPNSPLQRNEDEDGTNNKFSAYYYVFNTTANETDTIPYVHTRHYRDILAKAKFDGCPRSIGRRISISRWDQNSGTIPFEFIEKVKDKINEMFLAKAKINENGLKILYVTKDVCVGAKTYYKHLQNISFELFNINEGGLLEESPILSESTKLKQNAFPYVIHPIVVGQVRSKIKKYGYKELLKLQFNIFNKSTLNRNRILGDGPLRNISPDIIDQLLLDLGRRDLLVRGLDKWIQGQTGSYDSCMRAKSPPPGYERDLFESHLLVYNIPIEEYNNNQQHSDEPPLQTVSNLQSADQLDSFAINTLFSGDETTTERQHPSLVIDKKKHPFVDINSRKNDLLQYLLTTLTINGETIRSYTV
ncbi:unnamed protein product [Didymodactylos carnosus]|uniref:Uncharacterized protein n=2 Tax=Didymodactylos carnosus TaxID=1234261 RepID=A0A814XHI2_9BILA|nr:unnamed protein product [Didymodactylos carnosus]CAF3979048.1 unnamed protein product [Didymodactylos carnosus]